MLSLILQQLQLIELIRECKVEEALRFAQERLSEAGETDSSILSELERTLALLAFEEPSKSPFSDLLNQSHRQKVSRKRQTDLFCKILVRRVYENEL